MPSYYLFKKERAEVKTRCLATLLCFVSQETATMVAMENTLTIWSVLNTLADNGFTIIGHSTLFEILGEGGSISLDCETWELEFSDVSYETYFRNRSYRLEREAYNIKKFKEKKEEQAKNL